MIRGINIKPALNGFICYVGCQTIVFLSVEALTKELERYFKNPREVEEEYLTKSLNAKNLGPVCEEEVAQCEARPGSIRPLTNPTFV